MLYWHYEENQMVCNLCGAHLFGNNLEWEEKLHKPECKWKTYNILRGES